MRCAACGHTWYVSPHLVLDRPADAGPATFVAGGEAQDGGLTREQIERVRQASQPPLSTAAKARAKQAERQRRERVRKAAMTWGIAAGALAAAALLSLAFRQDVARIWPNAASAYAAIGMPVNVVGLEFSQIDVSKTFDGPTPIIVVSGKVRNITRAAMKPPTLRFSLRDDNGDELTHWMSDLPGAPIQPGGARPFRSTYDSPPLTAADLEATFATPAEIAAENSPRAHPAPAAAAPSANKEALDFDGDGRAAEGGPEEPYTHIDPPASYKAAPDGLAPRLPPEPASGLARAPHG